MTVVDLAQHKRLKDAEDKIVRRATYGPCAHSPFGVHVPRAGQRCVYCAPLLPRWVK